jgi:acyl-coenzyme A synthetase/AMP-(fatty) acid ligase
MITRETAILPRPASTYQLLLDAATAWPDGIATQWIPDPADHTRCLAWTYAELAGTVARIANALTALGVRRPDAVTLASASTSMLYAAALAAQAVGIAAPVNPALSAERIAELIRRTGSRVLVAAGPELDPQLWQRHTGGTTGAPKVAAHTHASQLACGRGIAQCSGLAPGDGVLGRLPLFHAFALTIRTGPSPAAQTAAN